MSSDAPWLIRFDVYDPAAERRREALFALGNGVIVVRAAAADAAAGESHYPGTYHAGAYARFKAEVAGETVEVESLANLPNPLPLGFRIEDGDWFDLDRAEIENYSHTLDLRAGIARRDVTCRWEGRRLCLGERRLVSMARPGIVALRLRIVPVGWSGRIEFRAGIDGGVENRNVDRYAPYPGRHLEPPETAAADGITTLRTRLVGTGTEVALAQTLDGVTAGSGAGHFSASDVTDGVPLTVSKRIAIRTSLDPAGGDVAAEVAAELRGAPGFEALEEEHRRAWRALWTAAGIDAGDTDVARALRFHAFHIIQTVSPHSCALDCGIPARGWHGEAYRGHIFWDELFVFPFLLARFPDLARAKLLYRYRRLDAAREAARAAGYRGAMFPWRSASDGREVTPRWQWNMLSGRWMRDHTDLAHHVGSAVAFNVWQHYLATGDKRFLADCGAEMILEIARFWASRVEHDRRDDRYDIRGVVGPDEFHTAYPGATSSGLVNNAYTNVMAVWTLCRGLDVLDHLSEPEAAALRARLDLRDDEFEAWDRISRRIRLAFHGDGILSQFEGFDALAEFREDTLPERFAGERLDWALEATGQSANAFRTTKQADALTLFYLFSAKEVFGLMARIGYGFDAGGLERTCRYYFDRTTHRSSLSRVVYAGALAESDGAASWRLFREALGTDFFADKSQSTAEGIHLGAMGGAFDVLQRRYFGIAPVEDGLHFTPAPPGDLCPMRLRLRLRGHEFSAEWRNRDIVLTSRASNREPLRVRHPSGARLLHPGGTLVWRTDATEARQA